MCGSIRSPMMLLHEGGNSHGGYKYGHKWRENDAEMLHLWML